MEYYFAPLEGITDSIFRSLHSRYFPGVDRYFAPFLSPTVHRKLTPREARELPPADSISYNAVPQVLTKVAEDFIWFSAQCRDLGYREINLNCGCPSGTVTAKGKGAGMLQNLDGLDRFLEEVFSKTDIPISVKTRIGFHSPEEFPAILEIFNRYPMKALTIHPRVRAAFYASDVDMQAFDYGYRNSKNPVCYNGNLCSLSQIEALKKEYPELAGVMVGRGLVADPGMFTPGRTTVSALEQFHDELLEAYLIAFGGSRNAMFRLKENWRYLICRFDGGEKLGKKLQKTTDLDTYRSITREIFHCLPLKQELTANW